MLVVPYSHDQPDHAYRLKKLGVARRIMREKYNAETAASEIAQLLSDGSYAQRATEVAADVKKGNGVKEACDLLEQLVASVPEPVSMR